MPEETLAESDAPPRPDAKPLTLERGDAVGRYVVLDRLGQGGMGVVFAAYDPELDRKVALKLLHADADGSTDGGGVQRRLMREAQAMARLSHPNVVTVHDVGVHADRVFVAMEFVPGKTLRVWLRGANPAWREVLDVFASAGHGLVAAHAAGLVHRDFKPDNVMLGDDGRVRVMDFGLARNEGTRSPPSTNAPSGPTTDAFGTDLTGAGSILGTPAYMAPEQHLGLPTDARTDQFSYCVALWEALYGDRPFHGGTMIELACAIMEGEPREPPADTRVPTWVRRIVARGLAKDPGARWPSIEALLTALAHDPSRARSRRLALAGAIVVAGGVAVAAWVDRLRDEARCHTRSDDITTVWNDDVRASVEAGLAATGAPLAADTWVRLQPRLDAFVDEWRSVAFDTCITKAVGTGREPAVAGECLDERLAGFQTFVDALAEPDAALATNAVLGAAELPGPSECREGDGAAGRTPLPADPAARGEVSAVRERLAQARVLGRIGRIDEARSIIDESDDRAGELAWEPLLAEVSWIRGWLAAQRSQGEDARFALEEAYFLAGAHAHDHVAAHAAIELVIVEGELLAHRDQGFRWARAARMVLRRAGWEHSPAMADLLNFEGNLLHTSGDPVGAEERQRDAATLLAELLGATHPQTATVQAALGQAVHMQGRFDDALEIYRAAHEVLEQALGADHPSVVGLVFSIGQANFDRGRFDEAFDAFSRADEIIARTLGPRDRRRAHVLNALGNAHFVRGEIDRAATTWTDVLDILETTLGPDHPEVAGAYANMARIASAREDHARALELQSKVLRMQQSALGPEHPDVAAAHYQVGTIQAAIGDQASAIESFSASARVVEKAFGREHPQLALPLTGLGRSRVELGKPAEAIEPLERALQLHEGAGAPPPVAAETCFYLSRALWESEKDRGKAVALARRASEGYVAGGPGYVQAREGVEAWLRAHHE